ncbi:MAG TPA: phosphatase PAP2 family protein [Chryseolinea sp.]|nr:phosphatase PAP2 family protein [Chryseolinea sp.]
MIDSIIELDKQLFLIFNGMHTTWLDPVMEIFSKTVASVPLYGFLIYQIFRTYKQRTWGIILSIGLLILMTDQFTSGLMKPFFERPRPSHEPTLQGLVHIVNGYSGGNYGFASSHSANTFGLAMFLTCLRREKPWISWLFLWAAFVSYTRIYLGVHYPGDIIVGGLIGVLFGWLVFKLYTRTRILVEKRGASAQ